MSPMQSEGMVSEDVLVKTIIIVGLLLLAFRPTREFIWRRMDFFVPFGLGVGLGLMILPAFAAAAVPRWYLVVLPIATGGVVATQTRHWFRSIFRGDDDGKNVNR